MNLKEYYKSKIIVISAGPTYEKIDPVRFIGNYSTGKMGFALAEVLAENGASVHLVAGPTQLKAQHVNIITYPVESAIEMYEKCNFLFINADIAIMAAAVADYRPAEFSTEKIKKNEDTLTLHLVKNPDILASLGAVKKANQKVIGFALETNNELENAKKKLEKKNADAIVLNSLQDKGAGFKHQTNKITILLKNGSIFEFPLKDKKEVAQDIIQCIVSI